MSKFCKMSKLSIFYVVTGIFLAVFEDLPHVVEIGSGQVQCRRKAASEELGRVETKRRRSSPLAARAVARLDSVY